MQADSLQFDEENKRSNNKHAGAQVQNMHGIFVFTKEIQREKGYVIWDDG